MSGIVFWLAAALGVCVFLFRLDVEGGPMAAASLIVSVPILLGIRCRFRPRHYLAACSACAIVWCAVALFHIKSAQRALPLVLCRGNLKTIALALDNYRESWGTFPPAVARYAQQPPHSWRVAVLPQLGHQELYERYDLSETWDGAHNRALLDEMPREYLCLDADRSQGSTPYYAVAANGAFLASATSPADDAIALVIEGATNRPWTEPNDANLSRLLDENRSSDQARDHCDWHRGNGPGIAFADGLVQGVWSGDRDPVGACPELQTFVSSKCSLTTQVARIGMLIAVAQALAVGLWWIVGLDLGVSE